jgi:nitrate reductase (NAD(P)H)
VSGSLSFNVLTSSETHSCWCFWSYTASFLDIESSSVIMVRAMDESLVLQQKDIYWNATGMMKYVALDPFLSRSPFYSNWWFRVAAHRFEEDGQVKIRFEHPTQAGTNPGGWMEVSTSSIF